MSSSASRIFISHASRDRKVANALCQSLENRGLNCWIASRNIEPSEGYQDAIVAALSQSSLMILVFSKNANNSQEIKKEISLAGQYLVPVIPVRIEDVLPQGGFQYELATRQWIDLFEDWEGAIERIVQKVNQTAQAPAEQAHVSPPRSDEASRPLKRKPFVIGTSIMGGLAVLALGAWLFVPGAIAFLFESKPTDPPALYPETELTRLQGFTLETSPQEIKPGVRLWDRVAPDRWRETYPDETTQFAKVVGRSHVADCDGSIAERTNSALQFFLPDKGCSTMMFYFRTPEKKQWIEYVAMDNVR